MPCIYCVVWWSMILHQSVQPQNVCYFTIQMMLYVSILWQIKTMICRMSMIDLITFLLLADTDLTRSLCCSLFDLTSSSGHWTLWTLRHGMLQVAQLWQWIMLKNQNHYPGSEAECNKASSSEKFLLWKLW